MRLYLSIFLALFIQTISYSQELADTTAALSFVEEMPRFNGEIKMFLHSQPSSDTNGRVVVKFIVDTQGEISHISIAKSLIPKLDAEAIQVVKELPCAWIPGAQNGKDMPVWTMLPVDFYKVFVKPDHFPEPSFDMNNFIASHLRYPDEAREKGSEGRVVIKFIVDTTGKILEPRVIATPSDALSKEALRVINLMPNWKPGEQNGKKVSTWFVIPLVFKLS